MGRRPYMRLRDLTPGEGLLLVAMLIVGICILVVVAVLMLLH